MQVLMIRSWHLRRFPEPKRGRGGLHGLVDHGQQLGRQRIEIDLVAELGTDASTVLIASYLRRLKRRSTTAWMRCRTGWNRVAMVRVAPAMAQLGGSLLTSPKSWPRTRTVPT